MKQFNKEGLTLTELLLTVTILAFALSSILVLFISCIFLNESNRNLMVAKSHAEFAMEEIRNTDFFAINSAVWNTAFIAAKGISPLSNESINITVTGTEPLNIAATVIWKDRGVIDRSIILNTLVTEP